MKTKNRNKMVINDFNIEKDILIAYFGNDKKVIFPNELKVIKSLAFMECDSLI